MPYFGFKAKRQSISLAKVYDCTVPYFGFKAKPLLHIPPSSIHCTVPYFGFKAKPFAPDRLCPDIVLCLILDSRQNKHQKYDNAAYIVLCLILDSRQNIRPHLYQPQRIVLCLILDSRQNDNHMDRYGSDCTVPYFGFKAKRADLQTLIDANCTVPYFGFKAKRSR